MSTRRNLLHLLQDGVFHSGSALGKQLGVSRAAIHKAVATLNECGLDIHSVSGKGYRWAEPTELLDLGKIQSRLGHETNDHNLSFEIVESTDSTSSRLLARSTEASVHGAVCLAETQDAGRGRRGRNWISGPYRNINLSMAWQYDFGPAGVSGLSIAAGVCIARVLRRIGIEDVQLKWPNDIIHRQRKLAGLLIDLRGESAGPTTVVLGVGLNVFIDTPAAAAIDQPWVDIRTLMGRTVDRNQLAADLVREFVHLFTGFANSGLAPFMDDWQKLHVFEDQPVRLLGAGTEVQGTVCGLDPTGALRVRIDSGEVVSAHSGEVSLRAN